MITKLPPQVSLSSSSTKTDILRRQEHIRIGEVIRPALRSYNNSSRPSFLMYWSSENQGLLNVICFYLVVFLLFCRCEVVCSFQESAIHLMFGKDFLCVCVITMCYLGRDDTTVTYAKWQACLRGCTLQWWLASSDWLWIHSE